MMFSTARRAPANSLTWIVVSLLAAAAFPGCGGGSTGARPDEVEQASHIKNKVSVAAVGGHVSIDGQPPSKDATLFVILNNPEHLEKLGKQSPKLYAPCDAEGKFAFTTYVTGDGVPVGKYVVTFVQLHASNQTSRRGGFGMGKPSVGRSYGPPDDLKNLYSDPEKNKAEEHFQIEVGGSGKTDYDFPLTVAGKDPVTTPSEYATTHITN